MAEIRNNFIKSKMNKDLDARLVPSGEYRDALNVAVSKSEGDDVGALENILGNLSLTDFGLSDTGNLDIIGTFMDLANDRIFVFMTNYVDTSSDKLSNFALSTATCNIAVYNINTQSSTILVDGYFLNFSKTHPILGVNLIDDLLFWTDNRNQPRKINVNSAFSNTSYYTTEDQISVAKYYPHSSIDLYREEVTLSSLSGGTGMTFPQYNVATTVSPAGGKGLTIDILSADGLTYALNNPGFGYSTGDTVTVVPRDGAGTASTYSVTTTVVSTMKDVVSQYLPDSNVTTLTINAAGTGYTTTTVATTGGSGTGLTVTIGTVGGSGDVTSVSIANAGVGYSNEDIVTLVGGNNDALIELRVAATANPDYDANWPGDPDYLKDKFVRFSYRFKFDDGEYSLIAPFTQECFIPQQDGYFVNVDEERTYESTEVEFMQNKVNDITLVINKPGESSRWDQAVDALKISEVEIICKQSNENSLKLVDSIPAVDLPANSQLFYNYQSRKPWKTLPSSDLLRVYDQVPVRALAQEVAGNRVIYGNYIDKHTPPNELNYNVSSGFKEVESPASSDVEGGYTIKEYQNHTLKQNRTYQVGVVLSDRYGRQSDVILSVIDDDSISSTLKGSTLLHPYKTGLNNQYRTDSSASNSFSFTTATSATSGLYFTNNTWPGDSLKITFNSIINSIKDTATGTPGLYSATNPLGWYTYKIVVKQTETDYYNVYTPGILNGYIDGDSDDPLSASVTEPIAHFALHGDNINKIPRDLSLLGPTQTTFRTGRPTYQEDPSYYQFINSDGNVFSADPYTEEGERLLKTRDRERDLDAGSQITNASVGLFPRVINYTFAAVGGQRSSQYYPLSTPSPASRNRTLSDTVVTVATGSELGLWDPSSNPPYNVAPVFYGYLNNPYIAKVSIGSAISTSEIDGYGQVGPSVEAGKLTYKITMIVDGGNNYVEGSKNISTEPVAGSSSSGTAGENGTGVLVNLDSLGTGGTPAGSAIKAVGTTIANEDGEGIRGFENTSYPYTVNIKVLAGDNTGVVQMTVDKRTWGTNSNLEPILAVYETDPIESKLDIYWETSTSGLISTLNTNILANDTTTPYALRDASSATTAVSFSISESAAIGTDCTPNFRAVNAAGAPAFLPTGLGSVTMELDSVLDAIGNERKSDFTLTEVSTNIYKIQTAAYLYYGEDAGALESYRFFIKVTAPSADYALYGTTVTETLQIGDNDTSFALSNVGPTISLDVNTCGDSISVTGVDTGDQLVDTFSAVNGANSNDARKTNDLAFEITQNSADDDYYLQTVPSEPWKSKLYIKGGSSTAGGASAITVQVTDAGGLTDTCTLNIDPQP